MTVAKCRQVAMAAGIILLLAAGALLFGFVTERAQRNLLLTREKQVTERLIATNSQLIHEHYLQMLYAALHNYPDIVKYFANRDRQGLRAAIYPFYQQLAGEKQELFRLGFFAPGEGVFLEISQAEANGGQPAPQSEEAVILEENFTHPTVGFRSNDQGPYCRITQPIYQGNEPVGTFYVAVGIEQYLNELETSSTVSSALVVTEPGRDLGPIVTGATKVLRLGGATAYLADNSVFADNATDFFAEAANSTVLAREQVWLTFAGEFLRDVDGQEVGQLRHARDVTASEKFYRHAALRLLLLGLGLLGAAVVVIALSRRPLAATTPAEQQPPPLAPTPERYDGPAARDEKAGAEQLALARHVEQLTAQSHALENKLEAWHRYLDAIGVPVIFLDLELRVVQANRLAIKLLADDQGLLGRPCWELLSHNPLLCEICPATINYREGAGEQAVREVEQIYHDKSFQVACAPVYSNGTLIGSVFTAKDLTQEKGLEKQLIQAQKMEAIATLAGGIAHDFNNILGVILGNADLLLYRLAPEEETAAGSTLQNVTFAEITEHLQAIKKAGNRAKELVKQILAFSRQGKSEQNDVDIRPVIKEAVKLLRSSLPSSIEIHFNLSPNLSKIHADPTQIQQVLMNLGVNAAQAMAEAGGRLDIELREITAGAEEVKRYHGLTERKYVMLAVSDTGQGMSRATLARIFDPFFTTRAVGQGTGLGLSVVHGIILAHQGIISVESTEGKGSVFTMFFPSVAAAAPSEPVLVAMPRGTETILFVDDEEEILKMRKRMLEFLGYSVLVALAGDQALELIEQYKEIQVVVTDLTMPRMSGLQLAGEIKKNRPDLPIILCSGFSEVVSPEEAHRVGIRKFMAKPLDMRALALTIREVLANRE